MWEPGRGLTRGAAEVVILLGGSGVLALFVAFLFGNTRLLITSSEVILIHGRWLLIRGWERVSCRWDEVTEVVVTTKVQGGMCTGGPYKTTFTDCWLVRKDGSRFGLSAPSPGDFDPEDIEPVLAALRKEAEARGIPWRQ